METVTQGVLKFPEQYLRKWMDIYQADKKTLYVWAQFSMKGQKSTILLIKVA